MDLPSIITSYIDNSNTYQDFYHIVLLKESKMAAYSRSYCYVIIQPSDEHNQKSHILYS